jgi:hypothetical protein
MAEACLTKWSTQIGVAHNTSEIDQGGWDHFIEFPLGSLRENVSNVPYDLRPGPLKCLVQVKGKDGSPGFVSLNLKNWKHLTGTPLPAFLLVLEFDGQDEPQQGYVLHIGREEVRRVAKQLRELSHEEEVQLHNRGMRVTYVGEHKMRNPGAEALKTALLRPLEKGPQQYYEKKSEWIDNVGYEEHGTQIDFRVDLPEQYQEVPEELIVDLTLGLTSEVEFEGFAAWDNRFGIKSPEPIEKAEEGKVEVVDRDPVDGAVVLKTSSGGRARMPGKFFEPAGIHPEILAKAPKFRFSSRFTDWEIDLRRGKINVRFDPMTEEDPYSLSALKAYADFLRLIDRASGQEEEIEARFELGDRTVGIGQPDGIEGPLDGEEIRDLLQAIENAWTYASTFGVQGEVGARTWRLYKLRDHLAASSHLFSRDPSHVRLMINGAKPLDITGEKIAVSHEIGLRLGDLVLISLLVVVGKPELREEEEVYKYRLQTDDIRVVDKRVYSSYEEVPKRMELRREAAEIVEDSLDCEVLVVDNWDEVKQEIVSEGAD